MNRNKEDCAGIARQVVEMASRGQAEAVLWSERLELTRYANNMIHQGTIEENDTLYLRLIIDGREAHASTNRLDEASLRKLTERVAEMAALNPRDDTDVVLPGPQEYERLDAFKASTALCTPDRRAQELRPLIDLAGASGLRASGAFFTTVTQLAVANSSGLQSCHSSTLAGLTAITQGDSSSGYGSAYFRNVDDLNTIEVAETAVSKAIMGLDPSPLEPGEYEVVLEPQAVADLLLYLAFVGFGARSVEEGVSFMSGRIGEQVTGNRITVTEEPLSPCGLYSPMDFEGMPRQRVELIKQGVAMSPVYDLETAARVGRTSTGNAAHPAERVWQPGPKAASIVMDAGESDMEELIGSVKRGLLVTRFHYLGVVNPTSTLLTGLTRDGTFLVEDGVICGAVQDMRFMDGVLEAFSRTELIGCERKLVMPESTLAIYAPAVKLSGFRFVGTSAVAS